MIHCATEKTTTSYYGGLLRDIWKKLKKKLISFPDLDFLSGGEWLANRIRFFKRLIYNQLSGMVEVFLREKKGSCCVKRSCHMSRQERTL